MLDARRAVFAVAALMLALSVEVSAQAEKAEAATPIASVDVVDEKGGAFAQPSADRVQARTDWDALKPTSGYQFDDPFSVLSRSQLQDLRALARKLQLGSKPNDGTESGKAVAALYARLAEQDIDADALLSRRQEITEKRRMAAMQVNPGIVGHEIEIVGFPIPAALANGDTSSFFLVSSPGMCSHVTLPPPNQVILVTMDAPQDELDFRVPVRVKGTISNVAGQRDVILVDGRATVEHAYLITKAHISMQSPLNTPLPVETKPAWSAESHSEGHGHKH